MTFQGVPWAIGLHAGGQPKVPVEAGRGLAYLALGGNEGPVAAGDCAVVPLSTPAGGVIIRAGGLGILNRFPGGTGQAYYARNDADHQVTIGPTSGAGRTDLVAVIVEDPQYAGQPAPADAANGPYVRVVVYTGVAGTVTRLSEVAPNQSGYALARVTLPAATSAVQASHITDLRSIPNPKTFPITKILNLPDGADTVLTSASYTRFPVGASWAIPVPKWAVKANLELYASGVRVGNDATATGNWTGRARLKLGTLVTADTELNPAPPDANRLDTFSYMAAAGDLTVPAAIRGTTQTLEAQALRLVTGSGVTVAEGYGTTIVAKVTFYEDVSTDAFTV
jgi:hypothetical protein